MRVGQKAKLKDEIGEVTIVEVLGSQTVVIKDEHGFDKVLSISSLILLNEDNIFTEDQIDQTGFSKSNSKDSKPLKQTAFRAAATKKRKIGERFIDLHDYALPEKYHRQLHLSKLEKALSYFEDALWEASNSSDHKLYLNHGIGEGILREEVRKRLKVRGYRFQDESYDNPGTTVVFLNDSV